MKTIQQLIIVLSMSCICFSLQATNIEFINNNLELAKQRAASEGKLILVDFWAHWCNPCTWMDEFTFSNKELGTYLNKHYISVRIDIDNLEGYAYKEQFQIRYLPSILILNEQGELIKKYEESFAPSKLLTILKDHNKGGYNKPYYASASTNNYQPANPVQEQTKPAPTYSPALSSDYAADPAPTSQAAPTYNPEAIQESTTTMSEPSNYATSTASTSASSVTTEDYYVASSSPDKIIPTASNGLNQIDYSSTGTYEFSVSPAPKSGYSVQVGAYYEYGNVLREVAAFQKTYMDVVYVHISQLKGANCYKVMLGHFGTRASANEQKAFLKEKGLDCFVKDLSRI